MRIFMNTEVNGKLESIAKKKQDLLKLEKLIKEKEKQKEQKKKLKRKIEIGELASKAKIDRIDTTILYGAFLEIADRISDENNINEWKKYAEAHKQNTEPVEEISLSISFKYEVSQEIKSKLKEMKFQWNKFRKEYYGYANKQQIESMLYGLNYELEVFV